MSRSQLCRGHPERRSAGGAGTGAGARASGNVHKFMEYTVGVYIPATTAQKRFHGNTVPAELPAPDSWQVEQVPLQLRQMTAAASRAVWSLAYLRHGLRCCAQPIINDTLLAQRRRSWQQKQPGKGRGRVAAAAAGDPIAPLCVKTSIDLASSAQRAEERPLACAFADCNRPERCFSRVSGR